MAGHVWNKERLATLFPMQYRIACAQSSEPTCHQIPGAGILNSFRIRRPVGLASHSSLKSRVVFSWNCKNGVKIMQILCLAMILLLFWNITSTTQAFHSIIASDRSLADFQKCTFHKCTALASSKNQQEPIVLLGAAVSFASSSVVLWSEASVVLTGCGPLNLNDTLERSTYWITLLVAGSCWFCRLAFQGQSLSSILDLDSKRLVLSVEILSYVAVLGAIVALGTQTMQGSQMDGLSGIDIEYCRSIQSFQSVL